MPCSGIFCENMTVNPCGFMPLRRFSAWHATRHGLFSILFVVRERFFLIFGPISIDIQNMPRFRIVITSVPVILALFLLVQCDRQVRGEFGWFATDDRDIPEPERSLLIERTYRLGREQIHFLDYETIRWVYWITGGSFSGTEPFAIALYEDNNTPTTVEVDLREMPVSQDDAVSFIRMQYEPLPPGRYRIKIAHQSRFVDQVEFEVIAPEGPGRSRDENSGLPDDKRENDDLLRYSS